MNKNHLSLIHDTPEDNNHVRYQPDGYQQQHITLSQIAARLRLISDQMKGKRPSKTTQDYSLFAQKTEEGIKCYLDDIARAMLAEHNARSSSHKELLAYLERIEHFLVAMQKDKTETVLSERQALMKDTAEEFGERLRYELAVQTKAIVAENQKSNQEISRQLREAFATPRFSVQLVSLQKQIASLQEKLDSFNDVAKRSSLENKTQVTKIQSVLPEASVMPAALTENQANTNVTTFNKSVIRKLAAGKRDKPRFAPTEKFQSTEQEQSPEKSKRPDGDKTNGDDFASQKAAQHVVGVQEVEKTAQSAKSRRSSSRSGFRKIFTRFVALF